MTPGPQLHRLDSPDAVSDTVADLLVARLREGTHATSDYHCVLTGGTVAAQVHRATQARLQSAAVATDVTWPQVHFWWGDERFVTATDSDRNDLEAVRDLLSHVPVVREQVHSFPAAGDEPDEGTSLTLLDAAAHMAQSLAEHAPSEFDLVMLGTGPDGHVASLFPSESQQQVLGEVVAVANSPKPPSERLSLSASRLSRTRELWIFATGHAKAEAVAAAWETASLPLGQVTEAALAHGARVHWFLDHEAASLIEE